MRGAIVIGGWSIISVVLAISVLVVFIEPRAGFQLAFAALIAIGFFVTILGRLGPAPATGPSAAPSRVEARSLSRGRGELFVDEAGGLHFTSATGPAVVMTDAGAPLLESAGRVGLRRASFAGLVLLVPTLAMCWLVWVAGWDPLAVTAVGIGLSVALTLILIHLLSRPAGSGAGQSLYLPSDQILAVVPYRRLLFGPSILIGSAPDEGADARWEEILLSSAGAPWQLPTPTADPLQWAREISGSAVSEHARAQAERYRQTVRRREAVTLWLATTGLVAVLLAGLGGTLGLLAGAAVEWLVIAAILTVCISAAIAVFEAATLR